MGKNDWVSKERVSHNLKVNDWVSEDRVSDNLKVKEIRKEGEKG